MRISEIEDKLAEVQEQIDDTVWDIGTRETELEDLRDELFELGRAQRDLQEELESTDE